MQLLPTYDFGTVPERAEDRSEQQIPADCPADSEAQQAAAMEAPPSGTREALRAPFLRELRRRKVVKEASGRSLSSRQVIVIAILIILMIITSSTNNTNDTKAVQDRDGFNWGYDPVLYDVPEGSPGDHQGAPPTPTSSIYH